MLTFEHNEVYDYPAAVVFARLANLKGRPSWMKGIIDNRVIPEGPVQVGSRYFESGKYSGFKSEKTMLVTELVQDRSLTMETIPEEKQYFRESYLVEPLSDRSCRVRFTIQVGNVPKVAEFFMRQSMKKEQPKTAAGLKAALNE